MCLGGAERHRKSPRLVRDPTADERRDRGPILVDRGEVGLSTREGELSVECQLGGLWASGRVAFCGPGGSRGWRPQIRRLLPAAGVVGGVSRAGGAALSDAEARLVS